MQSTGFLGAVTSSIKKIYFHLTKDSKKYLTFACLVVLVFVFTIYEADKIIPLNIFFNTKSTLTKCSGCNVLIIDIDILRGDELPCYGYPRNTTPNICSFASKSLVFKDNYSNASWTLPSMFSTITSLYPTFHQVRYGYIDKLSQSIPTLAEVLKRNGYHTIFVKDSGYNPAILSSDNGGLRGYDQVIETSSINQVINTLSNESKPWFIHYYRQDLHLPYLLPEGTKPIEDLPKPKNFPITQNEFNIHLNKYLSDHITEVFTKKAIEEYSSIITTPHLANDSAIAQLFYNLMGENQEEYLHDAWIPLLKTYLQSIDVKNPAETAYVKMMYDTTISLLDNSLASIFHLLESDPYNKNTITVIMSDHGEAFGEHGEFSHQDSIHTELFYVPLILRAPGVKPKNIDYTSNNLDIFPTILDLVNVRLLSGLQGKSLIPQTYDKVANDHRFVLAETYGGGVIIQNKNWLYYLPNDARGIEQSILYFKTKDPLELNNVSGAYPELTLTLYSQARLLRSYDKNYLKTNKSQNYSDIKLDPAKIKRLQKEGYF